MDFHLTNERLMLRKMYRVAENEVKPWPRDRRRGALPHGDRGEDGEGRA